MSKDNRDFFARKTEWAKTKDGLLEKYLVPYTAKMLSTGRKLLYVDCFAGKGRFDDGEPGSPLIACKSIEHAVSISHSASKEVGMVFVESAYASELATNLIGHPLAQVIDGTYEDMSSKIQSTTSPANLFLYVDPFGIKSLDFGLFRDIPRRFRSAEVLLNFNSFGFFRAACSALGVKVIDLDDIEALPEREGPSSIVPHGLADMLTRAAGGDYWKDVVDSYRSGSINGYEAEVRLSEEFCARLKESYEYVLNLPVRIRESNRPKYRMVHMTNHADGCLLMYEQMQKQLVRLQDIQHGGQMSLFSQSSENAIIDELVVREELLHTIQETTTPERFESMLARFVMAQGLTLSLKDLREMVAGYERLGLINVVRYPDVRRDGRPTTFMQSTHGNTILVGGRHG